MEFCACLTSTAKTQGNTLYRIGGTYVGWNENCNTLLFTGLSRQYYVALKVIPEK